VIPGGELAARPLHFFWLADCSGSMAGEKIQSLNHAIRDAIEAMRKVADNNVHAKVFVRAIKFSRGATWHVAQPTPLENFQWKDLTAGGVTDMGQALIMLAEQLKVPPMEQRGLPPVVVLVSDGHPSDDIKKGLAAVMAEPWGKKAVRIAIGIGKDADDNMLEKFIANPEIPVLHAHNSAELTHYIKWASTMALQASSSPTIRDDATQVASPFAPTQLNIPAPTPLPDGHSQDVW
jgi:uncharacterized protein YegL